MLGPDGELANVSFRIGAAYGGVGETTWGEGESVESSWDHQ